MLPEMLAGTVSVAWEVMVLLQLTRTMVVTLHVPETVPPTMTELVTVAPGVADEVI
jgi:hypothetical protein